jgi:nucleotide-binding universal stress UspA family protein
MTAPVGLKVLVALDGSASSVDARDLVAALPWPQRTSVTVLTAYDVPVTWLGDPIMAGGAWLEDAEDGLRRNAEAELDQLAGPLEGRGRSVDRRVVRGRTATVIVDTASALAADVVVLGSRGHGQIATMLLGSVSAEVAEHARCSVLVARGPRVSRLLVATDGSEGAAVIPEVLGDLAAFKGLPAIALSVTPVDSPGFKLLMDLYALGDKSLEAQRAELHEQHQRHAAALAEQLSARGIPAQASVRSGDAAREVMATAADEGADLVVMGSRGLHGLDRLLLGSVARNVLLHTAASVLIVRRRSSPSGG